MKLAKQLFLPAALTALTALMLFVAGCQKLGHAPSNVNNKGGAGDSTSATFGQTVTIAGRLPGYADGNGTDARFLNPNGVAVDKTGTLYVADQGNNLIRKIAPDGTVTTLAGNVTPGYVDGTGSGASFRFPIGVAVDASGYVYVADFGNNMIRKVSPDGVVTTLAGTGEIGYNDGPGAQATFNSPTGITIDKAGNLFVVESANALVRKITPDGIVSRYAGYIGHTYQLFFRNGPADSAAFESPIGVTVDKSENVYVADFGNNMIRKITPSRVVSTLAGTLTAGFANGNILSARFSGPTFLTVDAFGNLYISDNGNNLIRTISAEGTVYTLAGTGAVGDLDALNPNASFNDLTGIAVDIKGNVYVCDQKNNSIRRIGLKPAIQ